MIATEQTGIMAWVAQYGQIVYFFAQIAYWLVLAVAALWATWLFKRLVDFKIAGPAKPESLIMEPGEQPAEQPINIEEFVE